MMNLNVCIFINACGSLIEVLNKLRQSNGIEYCMLHVCACNIVGFECCKTCADDDDYDDGGKGEKSEKKTVDKHEPTAARLLHTRKAHMHEFRVDKFRENVLRTTQCDSPNTMQ